MNKTPAVSMTEEDISELRRVTAYFAGDWPDLPDDHVIVSRVKWCAREVSRLYRLRREAGLLDAEATPAPAAWLLTRPNGMQWAELSSKFSEGVRRMHEADGSELKPLFLHPPCAPVAAQEEAKPVKWQGRRAYRDEPDFGEWFDVHADNVELWQEAAVEKPHMYKVRALYAHPPREAGAAGKARAALATVPQHLKDGDTLGASLALVEVEKLIDGAGAAAPAEVDPIAEAILKGLSHSELRDKALYLMELNANQARTIDALLAATPAPNQGEAT